MLNKILKICLIIFNGMCYLIDNVESEDRAQSVTRQPRSTRIPKAYRTRIPKNKRRTTKATTGNANAAAEPTKAAKLAAGAVKSTKAAKPAAGPTKAAKPAAQAPTTKAAPANAYP